MKLSYSSKVGLELIAPIRVSSAKKHANTNNFMNKVNAGLIFTTIKLDCINVSKRF